MRYANRNVVNKRLKLSMQRAFRRSVILLEFQTLRRAIAKVSAKFAGSTVPLIYSSLFHRRGSS